MLTVSPSYQSFMLGYANWLLVLYLQDLAYMRVVSVFFCCFFLFFLSNFPRMSNISFSETMQVFLNK